MYVEPSNRIIGQMQFDFFLTPIGLVIVAILSGFALTLINLFVVDFYGWTKNRLKRSIEIRQRSG